MKNNGTEKWKLFAKNMRLRRMIAGYSQRQLCEMAGVSIGAISAYESGKKCPPLSSAYALADALGTTLDGMLEPIEIKFGGKNQ